MPAAKIGAAPQVGQESSDAFLALFVDVLTRSRRTLSANSQAFLANGFEVRVIDRPCEKQVPGVVGRRLGIQEFTESNLDVPGRKSRMGLRRLTVRPSEKPNDDACRRSIGLNSLLCATRGFSMRWTGHPSASFQEAAT